MGSKTRAAALLGITAAIAICANWVKRPQELPATGPVIAASPQPSLPSRETIERKVAREIAPQPDAGKKMPPGNAKNARSPASMIAPSSSSYGARYEGAQVLAQEDGPLDRDGRFVRRTVIRTAMRYPLVLISDQLQRDPGTGEESLLRHNEMFADHVMVRPDPSYSREEFERVVSRLGMKIRSAPVYSKVYLVSFDTGATPGSMVHALEHALSALKNTQGIDVTEPDQIAHIY